MYPFIWQAQLEQLRREQNPGRYREEQPALQLPVPVPPPPREETGSDEPRVVIIEM